MGNPLRALIVEDNEIDCELLLLELRRGGYAVTHERVQTAEALRRALSTNWDIVLSDFSMPGFTGMQALELLHESGREIPFLIVSGTMGEEAAVAAMQAGASDFLVKGKLARLVQAIERARHAYQRRGLEEELRQAQKMEAVGRLAGGIAHDFNNLLSVILGYAELVLDTLEPGDPMRTDMEELNLAAERARDLTGQLLAFSRRQVLAPKTLDLNEVVRGMERMLVRLLREDIELSLLTSPELGRVHADAAQLQQIIMNLVVNARDAMPNGGKLTIETADAELTPEYAALHHEVAPGRYVAIIVTDTGSGIAPEVIEHIFEPFFTTKEKGKGTGLGLASVLGGVKQSGGHVAVESEPGRGTRFTIYLPRTDRDVDRAETMEQPVARHGTETILLVEDADQVRGMMKVALGGRGYVVLEARNGGEALEVARAHQGTIHLLVTDVVMPRMNGRELAERLRSARPELSVLYVSGYPEDVFAANDMLGAHVGFLPKPVTPDALTKKVRLTLDGPVTLPPKPS